MSCTNISENNNFGKIVYSKTNGLNKCHYAVFFFNNDKEYENTVKLKEEYLKINEIFYLKVDIKELNPKNDIKIFLEGHAENIQTKIKKIKDMSWIEKLLRRIFSCFCDSIELSPLIEKKSQIENIRRYLLNIESDSNTCSNDLEIETDNKKNKNIKLINSEYGFDNILKEEEVVKTEGEDKNELDMNILNEGELGIESGFTFVNNNINTEPKNLNINKNNDNINKTESINKVKSNEENESFFKDSLNTVIRNIKEDFKMKIKNENPREYSNEQIIEGVVYSKSTVKNWSTFFEKSDMNQDWVVEENGELDENDKVLIKKKTEELYQFFADQISGSVEHRSATRLIQESYAAFENAMFAFADNHMGDGSDENLNKEYISFCESRYIY